MILTLGKFYTGETVRLSTKDLTHITDGPVLVGATVTISVTPPGGVAGNVTPVSSSGDDWYADYLIPATVGEYLVKMTAAKGGAVWEGKATFWAETF